LKATTNLSLQLIVEIDERYVRIGHSMRPHFMCADLVDAIARLADVSVAFDCRMPMIGYQVGDT
jgi:hypothetical protein